jgi:hypothetical protein
MNIRGERAFGLYTTLVDDYCDQSIKVVGSDGDGLRASRVVNQDDADGL